MSYLKQRDGIYRYINKSSGADFSLHTRDRDEAERFQSLLDQRAYAGDTRLNEPITFHIAVAIYLQDEAIDPKDKYPLNSIPNLLGDISLVDIDSGLIDQYKRIRLSAVSPKTVKNDLDIVSGFMEWCVRKGYLGENPFKSIRKGMRITRHLTTHRILTDDQAQKIWNFEHHIYPWGQLAIRLLILTGATRSELATLSWHHIDLDGIILVDKGFRRKIVYTNALRKVLDKCGRSTEWVFPKAKQPAEHIAEDTIYRAVRHALDDAGAGHLTFSNVARSPQTIRRKLENSL